MLKKQKNKLERLNNTNPLDFIDLFISCFIDQKVTYDLY